MRNVVLSSLAVLVMVLIGCQSQNGSSSGACGGKACGSACGSGACGSGACGGGACGGMANDSAKYANIVMVGYHSDTCATCKKIGPTAMEVAKDIGMMAKLDFTTDATKKEAEKTAQDLGMTKAWNAESGTGFVVIFNKNNPDNYRVLKGSTNADEYRNIFKDLN